MKKKYQFFLTLFLFFNIASTALADVKTCDEFLNILNSPDAPHNFIEEDGSIALKAPYWFNIRKLKDINLRENAYTVDYKFRVLYLDPRLEDLGKSHKIPNGFFCKYPYPSVSNRYQSLNFYATTVEDLKVTADTINFNYVDGDFFIVRLIEKTSVFSTTTALDFRKFPFDSQTLDIRIYAKDLFLNNDVSEDFSETPVQILMTTDEEMSQDPTGWLARQIFGWEIGNYQISFDEKQEMVLVEIRLDRDPYFYIVKIIFPVMLVVLISWSVFLIHPRSIEARVNVTIVCLLALIAYNFVIDDVLPKVSYITTMDLIILASYVFAGMATIYSIISFRNHTLTDGDKVKLSNADRWFRNASLPIYLAVIFSAIFFMGKW